ncbi:MAG: M14 family zinc carboxypeptidase [Planctomycetota bacterium]
MLRARTFLIIAALCGPLIVSSFASDKKIPVRRGPDPVDVESTRKIREFTTDPSFLTSWVDYLPASDTVTSPTQYLGYVVGTPRKLTPPEKINGYFRKLASESPRVQVFSMGRSHGGREMVVAAVADPELLSRLEEIKAVNRELADPRVTDEKRALAIVRSTPPIYWMTAGLHSPETGPPEMVMELAYRLVVSEQPHIQQIRKGVIALITPVLEMDGRARMVDWYHRFLTEVEELEDSPQRMAPYWGDYTAHDNNRDGLQQSQPLTRHFTDTYYEYLPVISLDLHESVPLLYVSMGTGPYNDSIDPITISEWQWISSYEVSECTKLGLRGVWTWGFYTGWYPGYLLWVPNNHNGIGRFYETFGNGHPGTFKRKLKDMKYAERRINRREWYRPWPPEKEITWSLRNNTNYMQTGVLASLQLAARNGETLLYNFWRKNQNSIERGRSESPHAFLIPSKQRDRGMLHSLLWLMERHRIEVHEAMQSATFAGDIQVQEGDYLVLMNQPYRNFAKTLLMKQEFPKTSELNPYDDISWSLNYMLGLEIEPIGDKKIFTLPAKRVTALPELAGSAASGGRWIVRHQGQASLATLRWAIPRSQVRALAEEWQGHPRGSLFLQGIDAARLNTLCQKLHLDAIAVQESPEVKTVDVNLPRLALFHTWAYTQDSGWARYTLEELKIPYTLINKDHLRRGNLGELFDVILVPSQSRLDFKTMVHGLDPKWGAMPYNKTEQYPSHGVIDASPDITGGMGFEGLAHLQKFVQEGGLLITLGSAGRLATEGGLVRNISSSPKGVHPGSHITSKVLRPEHPVAWGYPEVTYVFRGNLPLFGVREYDWGRVVMQYGTQTRAEAEEEADRKADIPVPESSPKSETKKEKPRPLCLSGLVKDPGAIQRKAAIIDAPTGKGRVLFFSWNPLHRHQNHHDHAFVTNAMLFYDDFPQIPSETEMLRREESAASAGGH